jgi:hypothetical protein
MLISRETEGNRSSRFTCSNASRMKVYYGRKLEARTLRRQGLLVKQIAEELAADTRAVGRRIGTTAPTGGPSTHLKARNI